MRTNNDQPNQRVEGETSSDTSAPKSRPWSQDQRLDFIDFRLYWEGRINRSDLRKHFGISIPQASLDLAEYLKSASDMVVYDKSEKVYLATQNFVPSRIPPDSSRYLNAIHSIAQGTLDADSTFLGQIPDTYVAPKPRRDIPPSVLRKILSAIRNHRKLSVLYQSMSSDEPTQRDVSPHSLAYDGFRWHARVYCHRRNQFIDLVLARILEIDEAGASDVSADDDEEWNTVVTVSISANPKLTPSKRRVIESDYGMQDGESRLSVRKSLLYYVIKQLGLNKASLAMNKDPNDQQIVLNNPEEVYDVLYGQKNQGNS